MSRMNDSQSLVIPRGQSEPDAVRSFLESCLVPLLAHEFHRVRAQTISGPKAAAQERTSGQLGKEDGL